MLSQFTIPARVHPLLVAFLQRNMAASYKDFRVVSRIPNPRPDSLVLVQNTASLDRDPVTSDANFMITVQGYDREECLNAATFITSIIPQLSSSKLGDTWIHIAQVLNGPYFMDDPRVDKVQNYIMGVKLTTAKHVIQNNTFNQDQDS